MVFVAVCAGAQSLPTAIPQTKFVSGQNVVPYFEGWIRNADGSFDLVFGYFNRNWEQELVIPVGPDNFIEPGPADRGQPTFFAPRRQGWVYRVRVPADFGKQTLTWTIKSNGKTEKAYGELLPVEEITERIVMTRGNLNPGDGDPNKPPTVSVAAPSSVAASQPTTLSATVSDDGLPKPRAVVQRANVSDATRIQAQANSSASAARRGLSITWMQLRGPAKALFDKSGAQSVSDGRSDVGVRFPQPGTYVLRATANDGALSTKGDVTIVVGDRAAESRSPEGAPVIDNDRVTVYEVGAGGFPKMMKPGSDAVLVTVAPRPGAVFVRKGDAPPSTSEEKITRGVLIVLKDVRRTPLENKTKYPLAFPRLNVNKLFENDRVIVWDYAWTPGQPTPMHFHDKDVVVTYVGEGALRSTTPDGQTTTNEFSEGTIRFNLADRVHYEELVRGRPRAIITELK